MSKRDFAGSADVSSADRRSQTLRAYHELRRRILENEMAAGTQYLEQTLADELGMSRTPVREALIRLSDERLVEVKPRHGARVLPVSVSDMGEIYELLSTLEAIAAQRVAERGLNTAQLVRLDSAVAGIEQSLDRNDLIAVDRLAHEFVPSEGDDARGDAERGRIEVAGRCNAKMHVRIGEQIENVGLLATADH